MPRARSGFSAEVLSAPQLEAMRREISHFSAVTRERGLRYALAGRVGRLRYDGQSVRARVQGSTIYDTVWDWSGDGWEPDCSCPMAPYCKHAYAVARSVLDNGQMVEYVGDAPEVETPPPALDARVARRAPVRRAAAAPARPSLLDRLRAARDPWTRQQLFATLLQRAVSNGLNPYGAPFDEILREPDPDMLCFRLAREIARQSPDWLPDALVPYLDQPALVEAYAARARAALAQQLVEWAEQQRQPTPRSLRLVLGLARYATGRIAVTVQGRLTTPRLNDEPRTTAQLLQLRGDMRRTPGLLPPEQANLLEWLAEPGSGGDPTYNAYATTRLLNGSALKALAPRIADTKLALWGGELDAALARRAGIVAGAPVRLGVEPVRLLPMCRGKGGEVSVDFAFVWPDGRQSGLADGLYLPGTETWSTRTHPSFVIVDGVLWLVIEEPPVALLETFREAGGLPLPPQERLEVVGRLATSFPHLRDALSAHTRFHAARPVVALDLRNDDWLQMRVFAHTGAEAWRPGAALADGAVAFEYLPDGRWVRYAAAAQANAAAGGMEDLSAATPPDAPAVAEADASPAVVDEAEIWVEAPETEQVAPALQWLALTQAAAGVKRGPGGHAPRAADRDVGWWLSAKGKRMELFADAWEQRPKSSVAFFGTDRVRRLLLGEASIRPILSVESSGTDWFTVSAEWRAEGLELTEADLAKLRAATTRFVKLSAGWVRRETVKVHDETAELLADLGIEIGQGEQRMSLWQLAGAAPSSLAALEQMGADPEAVRAAQRLRERVTGFTGLPVTPRPEDVTVELRPYQQRGLDFLAYTASLGIGAVLADDMGLGKTIQALVWLAHLRKEEPEGGPSLVVCPASVVHNWAREAARFAPSLRVLLLTSGKTRHALRAEVASYDLVVTNYALLRRDIEHWREIALRAVIFDEAQNLKNPDAAVTRAALALQPRHRLALTGTPLENRALDVWSIVNCVNPGYLGTRAQFQLQFDRIDTPPHARTLLAAKLRPILLRRTKGEVAPDLPDRIEERLDCELTKEQRALYLSELRRSRALVDRLAAEPGGLKQNKIHVLAALMRLRQICCHPALAGGKSNLPSGKFEALFELLEPLLAEGHKVLLFSQFVECLKLLHTALDARDVPCHMLTGQTIKRREVVDAFQEDPRPSVFLVSLKAGGTGLNLTAASYVVLFDPWWNPAVEAQAIDRTHRIGQDRTVIAYRLLARGTIEEKIWELQQRKAALARDILGEGGFARGLTRDDLDFLLADASA